MKAMRDEKGEMVRNAHVLGFFRRICKLLYLRTKPVFVFDGGTPALKRRTVIARRRQRENAQSKIRKTAEKLLLNHLKQMRLQELTADLEKQRRENDVKGKRPIAEVPNNEKETEKGESGIAGIYNQENLDQMLASSLAAEENEDFTNDGSASGAGVKDDEDYEEEEEDEDEEIILPEMHGKVDPAVLAALPPSMQLDLLVQMRERLMAENRQKYQKVKKAPSKFSELQIESYLKTVAFRREIDGVQKAASGRGIGGLRTSRIASEANREFIFSSSFTGDKQTLTSVAQERSEVDQSRASPANCSTNAVNKVLSSRSSGGAAGPAAAETGKEAFHEDVDTFLDERGRRRVSRARAFGIRMTRDLQRNLDLMKEIDLEKSDASREENNGESISGSNPVHVVDNSSYEITDKINYGDEKTEEPAAVNGTSIEISFEDILENENGNDDDDDNNIFARLVAGDQVTGFPIDISDSLKQASINSASDNEWEEGGLIENRSPHEGCVSDEGEAEWEDGIQDIALKSASSCRDESVTKGALEEEANIQEAVRRSLDDIMGHRSMHDVPKDHVISIGDREMISEREYSVFVYAKAPLIDTSAADKSQKTMGGVLEEEANVQEAIRRSLEDASGRSSMKDLCEHHIISEGAREGVSKEEDRVFVYEQKEEGPEIEASEADIRQSDSTSAVESNRAVAKSAVFVELSPDKNNLKHLNHDGDNSSGSVFDAAQQMFQAALDDNSCGAAELGKVSGVDAITDADGTSDLAKEKTYGGFFSIETEESARRSSFSYNDKDQEMMEDRLEEEILFLGKEREELGTEQRKLERNSESVSSEMFAECQELLQMFGLPYIIAPMEAEAECAFMELSNLVDGVVTDDSDAFLFGARSVYKNIFDDRKYVETYFMKDIENELGLDREKLIHMALLLGSDYTEGISGIGIVNAIEVVNAFPGKDGLREFREWIESPDPNILGKLHVESGGNSRRKRPKGSEKIMSCSSGNAEGFSCDQHDDAAAERVKQIFMDKHRNVSKNWHISSSFPSDAVISAYAFPQVDKSTEALSWGKPDLFVLRKLCWEKFGWGTSKADELLLPVLKEYNKHETQLRLEAFYTFNERFAKIRSKRINKAVKEITKHKSSELMDETTQQPTRGKKRKAKPSADEASQSGVVSTGAANTGLEGILEDGLKKGSPARRGRGRGQTSGRARRKKMPSCPDTENCSGESNEEMHLDKSEELRRSGRLRKTVNYNDEFDESDKDSDENHLKGSSTAHVSSVDQTVGSYNQANNGNELNVEGCDVGIEERNFVEETEGADNNTSAILMDDNNTSAILMDDYIQFGGGFCVDEDEGAENTTGMILEKSDGLNFGDSLVDENRGGNDSSILGPIMSNEKTGLVEAENDSGNRYSKSLRPMPNLRKKKKRNLRG